MGTMLDCGPTAREQLARLLTPTRNRFYYGKMLDAFHLGLEQDYGNRKRWLLNRLSLGTGVLCGLRVEASDDRTQVRVGPGVAIDGWGREIVVEAPSPGIDPRQPTDDCGRPVGPPLRPPRMGRVTLWLSYHECEAEPAPVLVSDCERTCENGLIRERYRLRITAGVHQPPVLVTPEQCKAMFSALPDKDARRATIYRTLASLCAEPAESCVPLATIELDQRGLVARIDAVRVRRGLYSNAVLLELLLCLADRVDECCPPAAVKSLSIESGNGQTGDTGQPLAQPLVVEVTANAAPVQGEQVTFRVAGGMGEIGDTAATLGPAFQVNTGSNGLAKLPIWKLGPVVGAQHVTAEIAAGAPSLVTFNAVARQVKVDLPVVNALWPPTGVVLSAANPATSLWYKLFIDKFMSIEVVFNRKMSPAHLAAPDPWLRLFVVTGVRNQYVVRRLKLRHATTPEANERRAAIPQSAPGEREFYLIVPPDDTTPPATVAGAVAVPGAAASSATVAAPASGTVTALPHAMFSRVVAAPAHAPLPQVARVIVLVKADATARNIVDQSTPALVLDADYQGTALQSTAGSAAGRTLWDDVWDVGSGGAWSATFGQSVWDALVLTADVLPSGNDAEGGQLASWFEVQF